MEYNIDPKLMNAFRRKEARDEMRDRNKDSEFTNSDELVISYKPKYDADCGRELLRELRENKNPAKDMSPEELDITIDALFDSAGLSYASKNVILLRKGIGDSFKYTLGEVAHIFKTTPERIRQVESKAMSRLSAISKLEGFVEGAPHED
jgi:DNA-directed RNA polymerase sigma subunit (sigma70/sigma32)|tara:strand:+ start:147 stop:596 length:450 start_codon:yes stop_codon:yes gene_type:complete